MSKRSRHISSPAKSSRLRVGYVPLIDAAPLIVARHLRYFADEGLEVELERQIGWGNVRDKLTFGRLDAAHALMGMPLFSQLSREWFSEPLLTVMNLGSGGNAITISRRLADAGVDSAQKLAEFIQRDQRQEALVFAHVFNCSMHHYLLREWLSAAGIDPDNDIRLRVFPPPQMSQHMEKRHLDGFCVGEPWNILTERNGAGMIVAITTDIIPNHPEKALVVSRRWAAQHAPVLPRLIRALLRACAFCDDEQNTSRLVELLAQPDYIQAPPEVIEASLRLEEAFIAKSANRAQRPRDWRLRSFAPHTTFPNATQSLWLLRQMIRWRRVDDSIRQKEMEIAARCVDSAAYRAAAASLDLPCPPNDFAPMQLRTGLFDPAAEPAAPPVHVSEGVPNVSPA